MQEKPCIFVRIDDVAECERRMLLGVEDQEEVAKRPSGKKQYTVEVENKSDERGSRLCSYS